MVNNATKFRAFAGALLLAALVMTAAAWLRGAEYDEQYTLFLTAGTARPDWPDTAFPAGNIAAVQAGHASLSQIALDLRATDVHPPLYFWAVSLWRRVFGPTLFAARMLSVLCGVISLGLIGIIARRCTIRPVVTMLLTLGCYGFVYTNAIARGFAPAQMLILGGIALLFTQRPLLAGLSLGAACCCNYLAVFVAAAAIAAASAWAAVVTAIPFLALDAWFFAAQHASRTGQFPSFKIAPSLVRLAEYQTAAIFGGLPLYADGIGRTALGAGVGLLTAGLILCVVQCRPLRSGPAMRLIVAAAVAPPIGLLLLGAIFNNTPIELRYLSFGLPFIALLIAWTSSHGRLRARFIRLLVPLTFIVQTVSIIGLVISPRTMQPARAAAVEATRLGGDVVLLPRGNDGVGIVGAFGIEAPASLPILLIRPTDGVAKRIAAYHRVIVARMEQDHDSIAAIAALDVLLTPPIWHRTAIGSTVWVYDRTNDGD